jgi:hypothetical protein
MNKFIEEEIEKVNSAFPSIYTKQDVITLLTSLNVSISSEPVPNAIHITERAVSALIEEVIVKCQDYLDNWCPSEHIDEIDLTLNYDNRIEVENITINVDGLLSSVQYELNAAELLDQLIKDSANE